MGEMGAAAQEQPSPPPPGAWTRSRDCMLLPGPLTSLFWSPGRVAHLPRHCPHRVEALPASRRCGCWGHGGEHGVVSHRQACNWRPVKRSVQGGRGVLPGNTGGRLSCIAGRGVTLWHKLTDVSNSAQADRNVPVSDHTCALAQTLRRQPNGP